MGFLSLTLIVFIASLIACLTNSLYHCLAKFIKLRIKKYQNIKDDKNA